MPKIVINRCYGGFGLSYQGFKRYLDIKGIEYGIYTRKGDWNSRTYVKMSYIPGDDYTYDIAYFRGPQQDEIEYDNDKYFSYYDIERDDPALVQTVEELGEAADGSCAELKVVEIPDDIEWHLEDYDGIESVHENHRRW